MVTLTLQVSNITGNSIIIKCDDQVCIRDLKQIISGRLNNLEPYLFRLLHNKVELSIDEQFINQIPIRDGDKLLVTSVTDAFEPCCPLNYDFKFIELPLSPRFNAYDDLPLFNPSDWFGMPREMSPLVLIR